MHYQNRRETQSSCSTLIYKEIIIRQRSTRHVSIVTALSCFAESSYRTDLGGASNIQIITQAGPDNPLLGQFQIPGVTIALLSGRATWNRHPINGNWVLHPVPMPPDIRHTIQNGLIALGVYQDNIELKDYSVVVNGDLDESRMQGFASSYGLNRVSHQQGIELKPRDLEVYIKNAKRTYVRNLLQNREVNSGVAFTLNPVDEGIHQAMNEMNNQAVYKSVAVGNLESPPHQATQKIADVEAFVNILGTLAMHHDNLPM